MSFLSYFFAGLLIIIVWTMRQPIASMLLYFAYRFADLLHKKEADKIIKRINRLDNEDIVDTLKHYRRKFLGLKLFGFCLLLLYSFITANIVYLIIHVWWVWWIVFLYTFFMYWVSLVRNISIQYLAFHETRMNEEQSELRD